jgi:hypothetical protein
MKCEEASERITALVDGELSPAEREELERHLSGCPACREARAAEEAVAARLRAAARPPLPPGFAAEVMAKVGSGTAGTGGPAGRLLPLWPLLAAASAVAAAVVLMVVVGPGRDRGAAERTVAAAPHGETEKSQPPGGSGPSPGPAPVSAPARRPDAGGGASPGKAAKDDEAGAGGSGSGAGSAADKVEMNKPAGGAGGKGPAPPTAPAPAPTPDPPRAGGDTAGRARSGDKPPESPAAAGEDGRTAGEGKGDAEKGVEAKKAQEGEEAPADEARDRKVAPESKAVRPETRAVLLLGAKSLTEGVQAVERILLVNREVATRSGTWKDAPDADAAEARREKPEKGFEEGVPGARQAVPRPPGDRVLEVRVLSGDLGRIVLPLLRDLPPSDAAGALTISGQALPPDVSTALREELQRIQDAGKSPGAFADGKQKNPAKESPPLQGGAPRTAPAGGQDAGLDAGRQPQEPGPPPKPTAEQLKRLAEGPPASREGSVAGSTGAEVVILEIHIRAEGK